ncbi:unnamed protein product [Microthlaspi erraticum]|uniref:Uncharacterized protein n=1 Tax=Microthlaspi erraticum TaxID=1685480 RepID=A0A6D2JCC7_9BRAS|nr:unnamed protein product [Microthlaspi erraticum]
MFSNCREMMMMDKDEPFVLNEVNFVTPKQSPQSNQTWPMDKIRQSRFQQKMSSLSSPVTPKSDNRVRSNTKSLLLQCLRESKSDPPLPRKLPASYSDDGILMDGVLVTSATAKKVSSSLGKSPRSSIFQSLHKNVEFSSPRSESGRNQETTGSQQHSAEKRKMLESTPKVSTSQHFLYQDSEESKPLLSYAFISPRSESGRNQQETTGSQQDSAEKRKMLESTPKAANPSKLQASAEPFILTPRQASPFPSQQFPYDHFNPLFPRTHPLHLQPYPFLHLARPPFYGYQRPPPLPVLPHESELYQLGPTGYLKEQAPIVNKPFQLDSVTNFPSLTGNPKPTTNNDTIIPLLPTTPSSSHPNTNTTPLRTPISTPWTANLSTSTVDGLETVTKELDLPSPSDELKTMTQEPDLSPTDGLNAVTQEPDLSPSDGLNAVTQNPDLSSPSDGRETVAQNPVLSPSPSVGLETVTQNPDLSPSVGYQTVTTKKEWSPSDDGLPTFTQAQTDFMKSLGRVLPYDAFERYRFRGVRMSCFKHLCSEEASRI